MRIPSIHFSQLILASNNRSFDGAVIGEKENRETIPAENPPPYNNYCMKLRFAYKRLIMNQIMVEAAGVELISVLRTRKLLILGTATRAKKAPLPDPLYVYCTKLFFTLESN